MSCIKYGDTYNSIRKNRKLTIFDVLLGFGYIRFYLKNLCIQKLINILMAFQQLSNNNFLNRLLIFAAKNSVVANEK